jgi:hypothetical protein
MTRPTRLPTPPRVVDIEVERLLDLLDRPIAFHRVFVELAGSVTAGLLLSQGYYWTRIKRQTEPESDGWFYKTQDEWADETGMGRSEQETARKRLRQTAFWQEDRRGLPAKLYFRVDIAQLIEAISDQPAKPPKQRKNAQQNQQSAEIPQTSLPCASTLDRDDAAGKPDTLPQTITETTAETTLTESTAEIEHNVGTNVASNRTEATRQLWLTPREQEVVEVLEEQFRDTHSRAAFCVVVKRLGDDIACRLMYATLEREHEIKGPLGAYFIDLAKREAKRQGIDLGFAS